MTTPIISVSGASVTFDDTKALDGFSLDVPVGALVALVGPSGCGKTTALRAIAGFEDLDTGTIEIRGETMSSRTVHVPPERRRVGMVFQEYALFPHISVAENVGYGVRGADRVRRVAEALELVGLAEYGSRFPNELSGGEQQRVALARALAPEPDVVLLDEPFSNLDAPQRERMRRELKHIIRAARVTAVLVTHDQSEALAIADTVAVMRNGRIVQVGAPPDVYRSPVDPWVAGFLGDAVMFDGTVVNGVITTPIGDLDSDVPSGTPVQVMVRPEWIRPVRSPAAAACVTDTEFYGHDQRAEITLPDGRVIDAMVPSIDAITVGDTVDLTVLDAVVFRRPEPAELS